MNTVGISLDEESKADLQQLVEAAKKAAEGVQIRGIGRASGFRSAIVRECISRSRKSILDDLQADGIGILL